MIYGVECGYEPRHKVKPHLPVPGNSWVSKSVSFSAAQLATGSGGLNTGGVDPDGFAWSFAGWYQTCWESNGTYAWMSSGYGTWLAGFFTTSLGFGALTPNMQFANGGYAQSPMNAPYHTSWQHIMGTFINDPTGNNPPVMVIYLDDQNESAIANFNLSGSGWFNSDPIKTSGTSFLVGSDGGGSDFIGEMSDLSFWPGVDFTGDAGASQTIPEATRRLFVTSDLKPVNPTNAINTLNVSPALLLIGDHTEFPLNTYGRAGPLTLIQGSVSDGLWNPSIKTPGIVSWSPRGSTAASGALPQQGANVAGNLVIAVIVNTSVSTDHFTIAAPWTLGENFQHSTGSKTMAWAWTVVESGSVPNPHWTSASGGTVVTQTYSFDGVDPLSPIGHFHSHMTGTGMTVTVPGIELTSDFSMAFAIVYQNQGNRSWLTAPNYRTHLPTNVIGTFYQVQPVHGFSDLLSVGLGISSFWLAALIEIRRKP